MTTIVILSAVALAATCAAVVMFVRLRALSNERFESALRHIDEHLGALVDHVRHASPSPADAPGRGGIEPTLDLDRLLAQVAREASARSGADVAAIEVSGPYEESRFACVGDVSDRELLRATLRSIESRPFDAMTIDWSHGDSAERGPGALKSALVVPILEDRTVTGAIGVYGLIPGAFGSDQAQALQTLVDEVTPAIANARRFVRAEQRATVDDVTGVRNHRGYVEELDREIARCRRSGRPLSLVIVDVGSDATMRRRDEGGRLFELACLLTDVTRATDVVCRRERSEFAFLLPETNASAAGTFLARLRTEVATHSFALGRPTLASAGLAEWQSGETGDALDRRASVAMAALPVPGRGRNRAEEARGADPEPVRLRSALGSQADLRKRLERELERIRGREEGGILSLLLVGTEEDDGDRLGPDAADVLQRLAERIDDRLAGGASGYLAGRRELALVLPGLDADDAAGTFSVLRDSLRERPLEGVAWPSLYAGSTQADDRDDADALLSRARGALWQARQAGAWTVVVAAMGGELS